MLKGVQLPSEKTSIKVFPSNCVQHRKAAFVPMARQT